jgi:hypothetical protein
MYWETIKVLEFRRSLLCFWAKTSAGPAISLPLLPCVKPIAGLLLVSACSSPSPLAQWPLPLGACHRAPDRRAARATCPRRCMPDRRANTVSRIGGCTDPVAQGPPEQDSSSTWSQEWRTEGKFPQSETEPNPRRINP